MNSRSLIGSILLAASMSALFLSSCKDDYVVTPQTPQNSLSTNGGIGIAIQPGTQDSSGVFLGRNAGDVLLGAFLDAGKSHGFISIGAPSSPALFSIGTTDNDNLGLAKLEPRITVNTQTGYVGISTTSPSASLDINGDLISRGEMMAHDGVRGESFSLQLHCQDLILGYPENGRKTGVALVSDVDSSLDINYPQTSYCQGSD
jgi:hypothetical protein